ncbi:MAG: MBL fold metallo-hydrolase [Methylobacteriaceae bacterium]|nr:MBL fold metallo-hydrolase [Methylobacteriaceae bacterium]
MPDLRIGDFSVARIEEMLTPGFAPDFLFPDYDPRILEAHPLLTQPGFRDAASGKLMSSMHAWLVRGRGLTLLVDTGCGNAKKRSAPAFQRFVDLDTPFLERLADAGVAPDDVTHVVNTHLHIDHVGWNTRLESGRWIPAFPRARYVWGAVETAHWLDGGAGLAAQPEATEVLADSVRPIRDAGLVDLVEDGQSIAPGLTMRVAPGHTAGLMALWLESQGETAVFCTDVLHQPMQIYRPDWNSRFCEAPDVARATRAQLLADAAERQAIVLPSHFGAPHGGRILRRAGGYAFAPLAA